MMSVFVRGGCKIPKVSLKIYNEFFYSEADSFLSEDK